MNPLLPQPRDYEWLDYYQRFPYFFAITAIDEPLEKAYPWFQTMMGAISAMAGDLFATT